MIHHLAKLVVSKSTRDLAETIRTSDPARWQLDEYYWYYKPGPDRAWTRFWVANGMMFLNLNGAAIFGFFEKIVIWRALKAKAADVIAYEMKQVIKEIKA